MASTVKRIPEGYHTVVPHLVTRGAAEAIEWYEKAFGAKEISRAPAPGGKLMHAEIQIGDSRVFLNDEFPGMGCDAPKTAGDSPVTIHLWVEDVDSAFKRAVDAGAKVVFPLADQFWGDRYGIVVDPYGHRWSMASHMKDLKPEELKKAAEEAFSHMGLSTPA
jgi:PhnB protein